LADSAIVGEGCKGLARKYTPELQRLIREYIFADL